MQLVKLETSDKENSVKYELLADGKNIGFGYIFAREINPIEIFIDKAYQSNGYGKFLFNSLLSILREKGLKGLIFEVDETNFRFINIIKNAGGLEFGRNLPIISLVIKL